MLKSIFYPKIFSLMMICIVAISFNTIYAGVPHQEKVLSNTGTVLKGLNDHFMPQRLRSVNKHMTINIKGSAMSFDYEENAEWRVYSLDGHLICKDFADSYSVLMLDGYDLTNGDLIKLFYYSPTTGKETAVEITAWEDKIGLNKSSIALAYYNFAMINVDSLELRVATGLGISKSNATVSLYPNPAVNNVTLSLKLDNPAFVVGDVFSVTGKKLFTAVNNSLDAGEHNLDVNISSLSTGVYMLMIQIGNRIETKKLIVKK